MSTKRFMLPMQKRCTESVGDCCHLARRLLSLVRFLEERGKRVVKKEGEREWNMGWGIDFFFKKKGGK